MRSSPKIALVLTGGGARGAYQAGFLSGMAEIIPSGVIPFSIVTGCSVGAINAAFMACCAHNFQEGTKKLWNMWANIKPEGVFIPKTGAFVKLGANSISHLFFGQKTPLKTTLLNNLPLKNLLTEQLDFEAINTHIRDNCIDAAAFTTMDYNRRISTTFFNSSNDVKGWSKKGSIGKRSKLTVDHVIGSAGLPLLFEPVLIEDSYFGDGSIKSLSPLRPAVHLGAEKILLITTYEFSEPEPDDTNAQEQPRSYPSFSSIIATMLQSAFSDALDSDLERLNDRNHFAGTNINGKLLRNIPALACKPTQDLSKLVPDSRDKFPRAFRKFLDLIGGMEGKDNTFLSYLTFEQGYTNVLLESGYLDALTQKTRIKEFFALK